MIVISYDGSPDADAAIDQAAQLMPGAEAVVLTVWEPFISSLMRTGSMSMGLDYAAGFSDSQAIDAKYEEAALETATAGAARATAAGLEATAAQQRGGSIANSIIEFAAEHDADAIVLGSRGRSAAKSILLGSVSHAVLNHAGRAVLVVPSPEVADRRTATD